MGITFTDDEIFTFISQIVETDSFRHIDGKSQRNSDVFNMLAGKVKDRFPPGKTGEQWRTKWKKLKAKYLEEKRVSSRSG